VSEITLKVIGVPSLPLKWHF